MLNIPKYPTTRCAYSHRELEFDLKPTWSKFGKTRYRLDTERHLAALEPMIGCKKLLSWHRPIHLGLQDDVLACKSCYCIKVIKILKPII